jgi:hypothetical protein
MVIDTCSTLSTLLDIFGLKYLAKIHHFVLPSVATGSSKAQGRKIITSFVHLFF